MSDELARLYNSCLSALNRGDYYSFLLLHEVWKEAKDRETERVYSEMMAMRSSTGLGQASGLGQGVGLGQVYGLGQVRDVFTSIKADDPDGQLVPLPKREPAPRTISSPDHDFIGALYRPYVPVA